MTRRCDSYLTVPELYSLGRHRITYDTNKGPYSISEATKVIYEQHRTTIFSDYNPNDIVNGSSEYATYYFNLPKQEGLNANYRLTFGTWAVNAGTIAYPTLLLNDVYEPNFVIAASTSAITYFTANIDLDGSDALTNPCYVTFYGATNVTMYGFDCWHSGSRETLPSGSYACGMASNLVFPDTDEIQALKPLSIQRYYEIGGVQKYVRNSLINSNVLQSCNVTQHATKANYFFLNRPRIPDYKKAATPIKILNVTIYATTGTGQFTGTIDGDKQTYNYTTTPHTLSYEVATIDELSEETISGSFIAKNAPLNISAYYKWENNL